MRKEFTVLLRISFIVEQAVRILSMQFILAPAAYVLPRELALQIANLLALLLLILPKPGFHTYWQMRNAFGKGRVESLYLAWGWLARPLSDFVVLKRLLYKRENPFNWRIIERNIDHINSLRESGESYIVVAAHYAKESALGIFSPDITYGQIIQVANPFQERIRSLYDLRVRIQYGAFLKAHSCWGRDCEFVFIKDLRAALQLYRRLSERGNVIVVPVDAPWQKTATGSYERSFAGQKKCVFSTGAAVLARLAKCPIISCVPLLESDGTVVLEWGVPIRIEGNEAANDIEVMNELLDALEIAVGERPTQYIFEIGGDRRWNPRNRRWEELTDLSGDDL